MTTMDFVSPLAAAQGLWLGVIFALGSGCAHGALKVTVFDLETSKVQEDATALAADLPFEADYPVDVYLYDNFPEGITLNEKGGVVIAPGFEDRYTPIAQVVTAAAMHEPEVASFYLWAGMHRSHSTFRRVYCAVQAPLRLLSIGLWSLLPLNWPCFVTYPTERYAYHMQELRVAAAAVGANLVVGRFGNTKTFLYDSNSSRVYHMTNRTAYASHTVAVAILDRERPVPSLSPPPTPTP